MSWSCWLVALLLATTRGLTSFIDQPHCLPGPVVLGILESSAGSSAASHGQASIGTYATDHALMVRMCHMTTPRGTPGDVVFCVPGARVKMECFVYHSTKSYKETKKLSSIPIQKHVRVLIYCLLIFLSIHFNILLSVDCIYKFVYFSLNITIYFSISKKFKSHFCNIVVG